MKTRNYLLFTIFSLLTVLLVSCEKETFDGPKPKVLPEYIVTAVAVPGANITPVGEIKVDSGASLSFTVTVERGYIADSVLVNGVKRPLTHHELSLYDINENIKVEPIVRKGLSWILMHSGEFKYDSLIIHDLRSDVWSRYKMWGVEGSLQRRITFLPDGTTEEYWNDEFGNSSWDIDENENPATLNWGGTIYVIEKLDEKTLVLARYGVEYWDDPTHKADNWEIFSHHE